MDGGAAGLLATQKSSLDFSSEAPARTMSRSRFANGTAPPPARTSWRTPATNCWSSPKSASAFSATASVAASGGAGLSTAGAGAGVPRGAGVVALWSGPSARRVRGSAGGTVGPAAGATPRFSSGSFASFAGAALPADPPRTRSLMRTMSDPDHVLDDLGDDLLADLLHALRVAHEERHVAEVVDLPRRPAREVEDELDRLLGEELVPLPRHLQPVRDVVRRVRVVEGVQVVAEGDPLVQVLHAPHLHRELRRADEQEGHEEPLGRLEVQQQPELLEHRVVLDQLRLVDDHHAVASGLVVPVEGVVQHVEELRLVLLRRLDAELVEDLAEEVRGVPARVGEQTDLVVLGLEPLDERARERRLAAAVLAGEHPAALAVADRVDEAHQRLLVLGREVEEFRVRRVVERRLGELPVGFVHDLFDDGPVEDDEEPGDPQGQ